MQSDPFAESFSRAREVTGDVPVSSALICAADLDGVPPEREWLVEGLIPKNEVTGVFGPGGGGKTLLMQQLATVMSANYDQTVPDLVWIGRIVKGACVLGYFCEDDKYELHRRQNCINADLNIPNQSESLRHLYMQSRVGLENLLITFEKSAGTPTAFYEQIIHDIDQTKANVVILDNIAQMFGGDENGRCEVTQFVNLLYRLVYSKSVTIITIGHPAKGEGSEFSGSTAWDACFRSRLYFAKPSQDKSDDSDKRILRHAKSNYSKNGTTIEVVWTRGVFVPATPFNSGKSDPLVQPDTQKAVNTKFLELLDKFTEEGRNLSHSPQARNFAPKMMVMKSNNGGFTQKQFTQAMENLLSEGIIVANAKVGNRSNRCKITGLALAEAAEAIIPHKTTSETVNETRIEVHDGDL